MAGLLGLTAAAVLARIWDRQHDRLVWARRVSATLPRDHTAAGQASRRLSVTEPF
jgi:hypothetical protein